MFDCPARFVPVTAGSDDFADASLFPNFSFRDGLGLGGGSGDAEKFLELCLVIGVEVRRANQQAAFVDHGRARPLAKSGIEYGVGFEDQPLRFPYGGIDNGAFKQLPGVAHKEPAYSRQPSARMKQFEKSLGLGAVGKQDKHMPAALTLLAGHFVYDASACRAAADVRCLFKLRADGIERRKETAEFIDLGFDGRRHALRVEVEQDEGRLPRRVYYIAAGSRRETRARAIRRILGGQIDFVREVWPHAA